MQDQDRIARFAEGRGFVAALDQSGGSTGKALALYGVGEDRYSDEAEMMALMHEMRVRIMTASRFSSENILGAILFERTSPRLAKQGVRAVPTGPVGTEEYKGLTIRTSVGTSVHLASLTNE